MRHKVEVRQWDEAKAKTRTPLDVIGSFDFDGPQLDAKTGRGDATGAKLACRTEVLRRFGRRVHSVNHVVGGGFVAVVEPPGGN